MHPLDKLDLLAGHDLAPGVPDWLAQAAGWEPQPDLPERSRVMSLPVVQPAPAVYPLLQTAT
jgi:hypothetical protein